MKKKPKARTKIPRARSTEILAQTVPATEVVEPPVLAPKEDELFLREKLEALLRPGATEWNSAIHEALKIAKEFDARISAALAKLREAGKYTGGWKPYGYALDEADGETLQAVEKEQRAIARARELRIANPKISLRAIAQQLEEDEFVARSGERFQPTQVNRMLRDEVK